MCKIKLRNSNGEMKGYDPDFDMIFYCDKINII